MKTIYGIDNPEIETIATIQTFLAKKNVDTTHTLIVKNLRSYAVFQQKELNSIPNALFFNSEGYYIPYNKEATDCNANVDAFIMDLKNLDQKVKSDITIQKVLGLTNNSELKTPSFEKGFDAYVFITWTVYAGRLNKEKAFIWIDLLEKAKANDVKVKYYLLNFDFQESWNMTDEQIEKLGLKE